MPILLLILLIIPTIATADTVVIADKPFTLGWTPATNAEGYEVERALDDGEYILIEKVTAPSIQTTLANKQKAKYRVRGFTGEGVEYRTGIYSPESEIFIGNAPPSDPTDLAIVDEQP